MAQMLPEDKITHRNIVIFEQCQWHKEHTRYKML